MKGLTKEKAELLAQQFRAKIGVSMKEPISVKTVLRKLNIVTMYRPLSEEFYGLSVKSQNGKMFILVNSASTRGRQHFTIAHELYHLFFDPNPVPHICTDGLTGAEREANYFASCLLMPKEGVLEMLSSNNLIGDGINIAVILRLENYFQVSRATLIYRLKELNIISEDTRKALSKIPVWSSAREYGYDLSLYQGGNEGLVISDFGEKAKRLFDEDKISEGHYIELLNMISYGQERY